MSEINRLKVLNKTKKGTVNREIGLNACIEDKPVMNILEKYGDNQDALSDETVNLLLKQNKQQYEQLNRLKNLK